MSKIWESWIDSFRKSFLLIMLHILMPSNSTTLSLSCPTTKERTTSSWRHFKPTSKAWSFRKMCAKWTEKHSNCIDIDNSMILINLWSHSMLSLHDHFTDIISIISIVQTLDRPRSKPLLIHHSDGKDGRIALSSPHLWIACDPQYDSKFIWKCRQGDRHFRSWRLCLHLGWQISVFLWHSGKCFQRIGELAEIMVIICLHSC